MWWGRVKIESSHHFSKNTVGHCALNSCHWPGRHIQRGIQKCLFMGSQHAHCCKSCAALLEWTLASIQHLFEHRLWPELTHCSPVWPHRHGRPIDIASHTIVQQCSTWYCVKSSCFTFFASHMGSDRSETYSKWPAGHKCSGTGSLVVVPLISDLPFLLNLQAISTKVCCIRRRFRVLGILSLLRWQVGLRCKSAPFTLDNVWDT